MLITPIKLVTPMSNSDLISIISTTLTILATALSPLIAVRVTRHLDDCNETRERKIQIYKTLMATRANTISPLHVEALNRIDLEFSYKIKSEKEIIDIWREYLDLLGNKTLDAQIWEAKRIELLINLLYVMGKSLNYEFNKTQIKNGIYAPMAHSKIEDELINIRKCTMELLNGERELKMHVTNLPEQ